MSDGLLVVRTPALNKRKEVRFFVLLAVGHLMICGLTVERSFRQTARS